MPSTRENCLRRLSLFCVHFCILVATLSESKQGCHHNLYIWCSSYTAINVKGEITSRTKKYIIQAIWYKARTFSPTPTIHLMTLSFDQTRTSFISASAARRRSVSESLSKLSSLRHLIPNMRLVRWKLSTNLSCTRRSFLVRWSSILQVRKANKGSFLSSFDFPPCINEALHECCSVLGQTKAGQPIVTDPLVVHISIC